MATIEKTLPAIVATIAIHAPIAKVYAALTTPEQLLTWWGNDDGHKMTRMDADLRVGGAWKMSGVKTDGEPYTILGEYRRIEPPHAIEFTWMHESKDGTRTAPTVVRYDLTERDATTSLTVTHTGFTDQEDHDDHTQGWNIVLGWARDYVTASCGSVR